MLLSTTFFANIFWATLGATLLEYLWYSPLFYGAVKRRYGIGGGFSSLVGIWKLISIVLSLGIQSIAVYVLAFESGLNVYITALFIWLGFTVTQAAEYYLDSHTALKSSLHFVMLKAIIFLYIATVFQVF